MKKLTMIMLLALMVGAVMAKPPTKQEKKAHKQAEIAAVLDVIKDGRFMIYETQYSETLLGEKVPLIWFDIKDTTYYGNIITDETIDKFTLKYREGKGSGRSRKHYYCDVIVEYYKKTGSVKINKSPSYTNNHTVITYKFVYAIED